MEPRYKAIPSLGWSLDRVVDLTSAGSVSGTDVAITGLNCSGFGSGGALTTDSAGNITCSADDTGAGGTHAILSATHTDSVANAVSRGSLIYANSTPAWDELTVGAADAVLASDGTDAAWDASVDVASLTASGTVTGLVVSGTAALQVGSDYINDITGAGLSVSGGRLNATAAGGGDSITVNTSAATDPDFADGDIDWTLTGGNSITATVACTGCVGTVDAAGLDVSDDLNLTAGRGLTLTGDDVAADAETYTDTKCLRLSDPLSTDDDQTVWFAKQACTLTSLRCESDATVTGMMVVDDGSPADADTVDLTCDSTPLDAEDTSLNGDATMASGDRLDLDINATAGTPTWFSMCWTLEYAD